jgi:glycosyltransferase involved in cell wall biosynthesis
MEACLASVEFSLEIKRIVVDGGSIDSTIEIAKRYGCRVFKTLANRSAQMNIGASKASASTLFFLHADTLLPEDWFENVMTILNKKGVVCGAFSDRRWLKLGIIKTTLINQLVVLPYFLGVFQTKLRSFYHKRSKTEKPFWIGII